MMCHHQRFVRAAILGAVFFFAHAALAGQDAAVGKSLEKPKPGKWMLQYPELDAAFDTMHKSHAATVSILCWPKERLLSDLSGEILTPVQAACGLAEIGRYVPHRLGVIDAMAAVSPFLSETSEIDMCLFGYDETCEIELWESARLVENLKIVASLPHVERLTVYSNRHDTEFRDAIEQIKTEHGIKIHDLEDRDRKSGLVWGTVFDSNGKGVGRASLLIYSRAGELIGGGCSSSSGRFLVHGFRNVPCFIEAYAPESSWPLAKNTVASSGPIAAEPGEEEIRITLLESRQVLPAPPFGIAEGEDGMRLMLDGVELRQTLAVSDGGTSRCRGHSRRHGQCRRRWYRPKCCMCWDAEPQQFITCGR